jgi:predicted enzyme related to lactoylglutathione lyase
MTMSNTSPLRGLANVSFWAADVKAARDWYSRLLGMPPYFQRPDADDPAYIEFRIGKAQDELGIINSAYAPEGPNGPTGGAILYWHVDDVNATYAQLLEMGAKAYEPITPRGTAGFVTASVVDPFGNILGIMYNPHYVEMNAPEVQRS